MIRWTLILVTISLTPTLTILLLTNQTVACITAAIGGFVGGLIASWDQKRRESSHLSGG